MFWNTLTIFKSVCSGYFKEKNPKLPWSLLEAVREPIRYFEHFK